MISNTDFGSISFDLPKNQSNVIKVIGVGGGGSNAINHMFQQGIKGVDFVVCNTDSQALQNSPVPNKIQLGVTLTEGLGAGANPDIGEQAAIESLDEIKGMLETNTKMAFITAGMGGGTGTGAAPVIAKLAKELDVLTVGIVTMPFVFEGKMRNEQSQKGIENLRKHVDSLIVINNNKLREVYGNLGFKAGFSKADEVLATASRGIAEVITHHYTQNIDLRDAKTVLSNSGTAIMGSATASGTDRAQEAIRQALDSPLLNDNKIQGAKNVLLLIVSGAEEITLDEIGEINDHIQNEAGHSANIIMGVGEDENLGDAIAVTIIATGFHVDQQRDIVNLEAKKIIHTLEDEQRVTHDLSPNKPAQQFTAMTPEAPSVAPVTPPVQEEPKAQTAPIAEVKPEAQVEPKVVMHTLEEETPVEQEVKKDPFPGFIKTSDIIRNINVTAEEVIYRSPVEDLEAAADDFVIIDTTDSMLDIQVEEEEVRRQEDQFTLSFDMPFSNQVEEEEEERENVVLFNLTDEQKDIRVNDAIEIVPQSDTDEGEVKRYSLEDYLEFESGLQNARPAEPTHHHRAEREKPSVFERKTVEEEPVSTPERTPAIDPFDVPIQDVFRGKADERKQKLKELNYRFNNSIKKIDEIEKEPAYKRMGIDLSSQPAGGNHSRLSVGRDGNDDLQIRNNNSFLHDNVD